MSELFLVSLLIVVLVPFVLRIPASRRLIRKAPAYIAVVMGFLAALFIPAWIALALFPNQPKERELVLFPMWPVSCGVAYLIARRLFSTKHKKASEGAVSKPLIVLGGVVIDPDNEATHFLFAGATGSGKTEGINTILKAVRTRRTRAVVADSGG